MLLIVLTNKGQPNVNWTIGSKVDELCTEICNVKKQSQSQKPHNSSCYNKCQSRVNKQFLLVVHKRLLNKLLIRHQNQNVFFIKTDFVFITLSLCTFRSFQNHSVIAITKTVCWTQPITLPKVYDKLSKKLLLIDSGACSNFLRASSDQCFGDMTLDVDISFEKNI